MMHDTTAGYVENVKALVQQYESVRFSDVHGSVLHLIPTVPSLVLDIGAGTGRDAGALAALGHRVVAVEPVPVFRTKGAALHPSPLIEWVDDTLPHLECLTGRRECFDVVMLTAVWMHLDRSQRQQAMSRISALVRRGGVVIMSLRHGPAPTGRRMFEVSAGETIQLAQAEGWNLVLQLEHEGDLFGRPDVTWTRLGFSKQGGGKAV
jgi:SAM-dependent methyltransferase